MNYRYVITPRAEQVGGGFKLQCFERENDTDIEMMSGVFPTEIEAKTEGEDWLQTRLPRTP